VHSLRMIALDLWRLAVMGLVMATSGQFGSFHRNWVSFKGLRQRAQSTETTPYNSMNSQEFE